MDVFSSLLSCFCCYSLWRNYWNSLWLATEMLVDENIVMEIDLISSRIYL